jgi:hypothetical protein
LFRHVISSADLLSLASLDFAKRVKSAAQVMLAPCVGPVISNMLAPTRSSSSFEENNNPGESSPVATPLFEIAKPKKKPVSFLRIRTRIHALTYTHIYDALNIRLQRRVCCAVQDRIWKKMSLTIKAMVNS